MISSDDYKTNSPKLIPLSIYIHTPWCEKKCPYCDFNSHAFTDMRNGALPITLEKEYLASLQNDLAELLQRHPHLKQREARSIFIGGGTPSLLSPSFFADLLAYLASEFTIDNTTEITLESNPGSAEYKKFVAYRQLGINRISLGVQSFDDAKLAGLGRVHKAQDALAAYNAAIAAGFTRINLDIMFGLPNQSPAAAMHDVRLASGAATYTLGDMAETSIAVEHISRYQLTMEPNTLFASAPPAGLPNEETILVMEEEGGALLREKGFTRYEVSAWARDLSNSGGSSTAGRAIHNLNYWNFGDYVGLGAGAHSKITVPDAPELKSTSEQGYSVYRERRQRSPDKYMHNSKLVGGARRLTRDELIYEFMLNALRLIEGFPLSLFQDTTGLPSDIISGKINQGEELGLLVQEADWLKPSDRGMQLLNDTVLLFAPPETGPS